MNKDIEENLSPYEPPKSVVVSEADDIYDVVPASKWLRLSNFIIDNIAMAMLSMVIGMAVLYILGEAVYDRIMNIPDFLWNVSNIFLYYPILEMNKGLTLGKLITGTRAVDETGVPIEGRQAILRTFCRIIPFEAFSFLGQEGRGWHDTISKSYVVKIKKKLGSEQNTT